MKREVKLSKIDTETDNVVDFFTEKTRLAKASGGGGDDNWLSSLQKGTIFTARQKVQPNQVRPWLCQLFLLKEIKEKSALLVCKTPEEKDVHLWVHILDYSRQNEFVEVLAILDYGKEEEIGTDTGDGDSNGTVLSGDVVHVADAEAVREPPQER